MFCKKSLASNFSQQKTSSLEKVFLMYVRTKCQMAGELGLEPRITGSKPGALPAWLHPIGDYFCYLILWCRIYSFNQIAPLFEKQLATPHRRLLLLFNSLVSHILNISNRTIVSLCSHRYSISYTPSVILYFKVTIPHTFNHITLLLKRSD